MNYIQQYYHVPAETGRRVRYTESSGNAKEGVITDASTHYIYIHFDGEKKPKGPFHPTDSMEYLGMGKVPKMTRSQQRYARFKSGDGLWDTFADFLAYEQQEREARKYGFSSVSDYESWLRTLRAAA